MRIVSVGASIARDGWACDLVTSKARMKMVASKARSYDE